MFKIWLYYYLFIKKGYNKRYKEMNSSIFALAFACLFVIFFFASVVLDNLLNINGFAYIFNSELPLGPIATILGFIIMLPIILLLNVRFKNIKNKRTIIKIALIKTRKISKWYKFGFMVFCLILFGLTLLMILKLPS